MNEIQIVFTGLKPGEKLHEELFISSGEPQPTAHPRIFRADDSARLGGLTDKLEALYETLRSHDGSIAREWGVVLDDFLRSVDG